MTAHNTSAKDNLWYKDAVIYELHIKAFRDSNCDGVGDFEGLLEKLDYLQDLGITAIWLLPFYPSPLRDDGYDIADYYTINPTYGNVEQFQRLLQEAHKRGLKVITELVINHTSDQHPWFQRARTAPKGSPERDYYVWTDNPHQFRDARIIFQDYETSNWTWDPVAQQYYWHRFFHHQPDLNYDNPEVQAEVFKIIEYWCSMGVDGFRLDAVPYLFEREGTNCENLPETHAFLKKLRKHVEERFPNVLLLAEANMWPEDSASYFGNGDECHMNYHFPVMPRMFMSLQMEDKYPITDIFDQTPEIPDNCQWGIFLRNHDELTLEMVTDEERDYMYKMYVKDPRARINLGIRHRLAPLMDGDRRKIELLNYLLFSLPGTPIIYYGDEIGMGDNYYLGDRDGVRTPMQWSPDRNAGFSEANPQKLYLPTILDPLYHYSYVNVELQNRNTSSLLWFMKRMINVRKKHQAFGRGKMEFINSENTKVLSFTRTYKDETILVVVNLSRYSQPVELDLAAYSGYGITELFSQNSYPAIKEDHPYLVTLSPYECQWFNLSKTKEKVNIEELLTLEVNGNNLDNELINNIVNDVLPTYLQKMRWFGGKARTVHSINIAGYTKVSAGELEVALLLAEIVYQNGLPEIYQLPLAMATGSDADTIKNTYPAAVVCLISAENGEGVVYDALYSEAYRQFILKEIATNALYESLKFSGTALINEYVQQRSTVKSRILSAEQSNSSVIFDDKFFLKIFRKVDRSANPDLEITKYLTEQTSFTHLPAYVGDMQWVTAKGSMVLAMMQQVVENNTDGWGYVLDRLSSYNEKILAQPSLKNNPPSIAGSVFEPVDMAALPHELQELFEASVTERIKLLGTRTGELHLALAEGKKADFRPEEFSLHYQRSMFSSFQSLVRRSYQTLARNMDRLDANEQTIANQIAGMKEEVLARFRKIYQKKFDVSKIRIHGDYHLGQTLFTGKDIIILDFEGEPASSYSERRLKRNALRDVAGMLRSFHYAAYASLLLNKSLTDADVATLTPFAELWQHYMSNLFLRAYLDTVNGSKLIPADEQDTQTLLETYILEKAVYELAYELNNRPDWVRIPMQGILSIVGKQ